MHASIRGYYANRGCAAHEICDVAEVCKVRGDDEAAVFLVFSEKMC